MKPYAALIFIALISFAASGTASAQRDNDRHYAVRVPYGDLNLDSDRGADTFIDRLDDAGARVCDVRSFPAPMAQRQRSRDCAVSFTQRGVVELDHQHVTHRYLERGGTLPTIDVAST